MHILYILFFTFFFQGWTEDRGLRSHQCHGVSIVYTYITDCHVTRIKYFLVIIYNRGS